MTKQFENAVNENKEQLKQELNHSKEEINNLEVFHELREQMKLAATKGGKDALEVKQLKEMMSNLFIEQKHQKLIESLKQNYPTLTAEDLHLCAAIKQRILNAEVSMFLQVSTNILYTRKSRLKQKFNLSQKDDLNGFIHSFSINTL